MRLTVNRPVCTVKSMATKIEGSARDRLLAAANELFYEEGVHTVGIDRVIERAGVAKASLYTAFGSKEELVQAYLEKRLERRRARIAERIALHSQPRERILSVFELQEEQIEEPTFRGCAFVNASAEGPRDAAAKVAKVSAESRQWTRTLFTELARDYGAKDFERLGFQLSMLYDAVMIGGSMDRDARVAREARALAADLLDTNAPTMPYRKRPKATGSR